MPKHIIQGINLKVNQGDKEMISNLNWTLDECEWVEIKGANNSGKTSLLNTFYGSLCNCTGQLMVIDYSMIPLNKQDLSSLRRKLGYATQSNNLLLNKTLRANLIVALYASDRIFNQDEDDLIKSTLENLGLYKLLKTEIQNLSFSEQILASIARAVIHKPKLLLLDQSFDYLSEDLQNRTIEYIQKLRETERMTVLSTSLIGWSSKIKDCKSLILKDGIFST